MTLYQIKPAFQRLLRPLAGALVRLGVTANAVTLAALILSAIQAAALFLTGGALWALLLLPLTLFLRMAMNALDGIMAKEFAQRSSLGAYLNEIGDVLSDTLLILSLAALPGMSLWPVALMVLGAMLSEFAGVLAWALGGERRYDGPLGKSDRALFLGAFALLYAAGWVGSTAGDLLFALGALLELPTTYHRIRGGLR
jgi:CDP-diacylglycerol--glycerol-3-phosphate 3-phosphatidyltransferase